MAAKVTRLRTRRHGLCAAEAFLDTIGSPNTRRAYAIAIVKTVDALDEPGPIGRSRALELPARRGRQMAALVRSRRGTTPAQHRRPGPDGPTRPGEVQRRRTPHPPPPTTTDRRR